MKRDMWSVLRNVAVGKAVVITTREWSFWFIHWDSRFLG